MFGKNTVGGHIFDFSQYNQEHRPRTQFKRTSTHKTTFDERQLIPIYVDEVMPGDTHSMNYSHLIRLTTPINPIMDTIYVNTAFYFVPIRQVWKNFKKFTGEQEKPGDTTDYIIPSAAFTFGGLYGAKEGSISDYMGLPTKLTFNNVSASGKKLPTINILPHRAYKKIFGEWFADENMEDWGDIDWLYDGDGDDTQDRVYGLNLEPFITNAKHNYFTSALPFLQKGQPVKMPIIGDAPVWNVDNTSLPLYFTRNNQYSGLMKMTDSVLKTGNTYTGTENIRLRQPSDGMPSTLYADLQNATGITVNDFRLLATTQQFLEKQARGGTRYNEYLLSHFGTHNGDLTLQRTQLLCITKDTLNITPLASTVNLNSVAPNGRPIGDLGAVGFSHGSKKFSNTFNEWGYIIGLCWIDAQQTYEQGINAMWSRRVLFDLPHPIFANLGEQAIKNQELYVSIVPDSALTNINQEPFGYTGRYNEMRDKPSINTGKMRVADPQSLSNWHLGYYFNNRPSLNSAFLKTLNPISRVVAVPSEPHFRADFYFDNKTARQLPPNGIPGLTRI